MGLQRTCVYGAAATFTDAAALAVFAQAALLPASASFGWTDAYNLDPNTGTLQVVASSTVTSKLFASYDYGPEQGIPEPGTWALMIMGFGAAGAGLRHRRAAIA